MPEIEFAPGAAPAETLKEQHYREYQRQYHDLEQAARLGRAEAVSHRGFLVGSAALAWSGERYQIFYAGNFTPDKSFSPHQGTEKMCAERRAIKKAAEAGFPHIAAIVTISKERLPGEQIRIKGSHDQGAVEANILHPCNECLRMFQEQASQPNGVGVSGDTVVTTINDSEELIEFPKGEQINIIQEERTVNEYLKLYGDIVTAREP